jgi:hypothetical protein
VRKRLALTAFAGAVLALGTTTVATTATAAPASASLLPKVISLPDGFRPEGIATGRGTTFYVGSQVDGAIYRGNLLTGRGEVFIPGTPGDTVRGLKVDGGRLFAAGGPSGTVKVYDVRTGRLLLRQQVGAPGDDRFLRTVHLRGERTADDAADPGHHLHRGPGAVT